MPDNPYSAADPWSAPEANPPDARATTDPFDRWYPGAEPTTRRSGEPAPGWSPRRDGGVGGVPVPRRAAARPAPAPARRSAGRRLAPVLIGLAAVAVVIGGGTVAFLGIRDGGVGPADAAAATGTTVRSTGAAPATLGLSTPAVDGGLRFTVTEVSCGARRVGSATAGKAASGRFCLVKVTVRNISDAPTSFDPANQRAYSAQGTAYQADTEAGLYANGTSGALTEPLNPGREATGLVVFDVPLGVDLTEVDLHDSAFSAGIRVRVG